MIDIDYFKKINDTYGHLIGDKILKDIVRVIKESLRETDILARWGGEEFLILLPETSQESAYAFSELTRTRIEEHTFPDGIKLTVSLGVGEFNSTYSANEFLTKIDQALYQSKKQGRNRTTSVNFSSQSNQTVKDTNTLT